MIGIAQRLNARTHEFREEKKTIWLTFKSEKIGLETNHIQELGIDIDNFFDPDFDRTPRNRNRNRKEQPVSTSEEVQESVAEQFPILPNVVCFDNFRELNVHYGIFNSSKNKQLEKLRSNENIRWISCKELKNKINTSKPKIPITQNKIVKDNGSNRTLRSKLKINSKLVLRDNNRPKSRKILSQKRRKI